jgi:transposase-like protein
MGQRKSFTAAFKAKVALEAIKGQRTAQELGSLYGVHPNQVTTWKKQLVAEASGVFTRGGIHDNEAIEQERAELYQQIGKLQVELDWLQKKSGILRR